jgi:TolB-like protein
MCGCSQWRFRAASAVLAGVLTCVASGTGEAAESRRGTLATEGSAPVLWVLSIGVSKYQDQKLDLQYAAADAKAIADTLAQQRETGRYHDVKTRILVNEKVTRESVLKDLYSGFLGQAAPSDIVVIFIAGHGTLAYDEYYFLPYPATQQEDSLLSKGLAKSDFQKAFDVLRQNGVKNIVVMLDTCEAGALSKGARGIRAPKSASEIAKEMAAAEGTYVLASAKGDAIEDPKWKHGAFTFAAMEALEGKADANGDGWLDVNELFSYVARRVLDLTEGRQHPSQDMKGTGLLLAAVHGLPNGTIVSSPLPNNPAAQALPVSPNVIFVLPFEDNSPSPAPPNTGKSIQTEFTNRLSKVKALKVRNAYSVVITDPQNPYPTLRGDGIGNAVSGSFQISGKKIILHAWIVDTVSGEQRNLGDVEGPNEDGEIFSLTTKLIQQSLVALNVDVSATEAAAVEKETNNSLTGLNYLLQAEGAAGEANAPKEKKPTAAPEKPHAALEPRLRRLPEWLRGLVVPRAQAEDVQAQIKQVLSEYMRAYQEKDLESLAKLYVSFSPSQGEALRAYLNNATDLRVEVDDVNIDTQADRASVSYTRRDHFTEKATGKQINLEVHLKKTFVREDGKWKFAPG